ncbi:MAG: TerB family tellurite resistance protein [Microthrixaceae bacterium]|nr:TerB family tellurite resistance protein [Microthrixaceae bacterium]
MSSVAHPPRNGPHQGARTHGLSREFVDQLGAGMREIVALIVGADMRVTVEERRLAVEIVSVFAPGYTEETLRGDLGRSANAPLEQRLAYLGRCLNLTGKEWLLSNCTAVMMADGHADERERTAVKVVGQALGMSPKHVGEVMSAAEQAAATPVGADAA